MRWLLLLAIRLYWAVIPERKRRRCLFRTTCSQYVYRQARAKGLYRGLAALIFRWSNCRAGYHVFEHTGKGVKRMVLPGGRIVEEREIAERLLL